MLLGRLMYFISMLKVYTVKSKSELVCVFSPQDQVYINHLQLDENNK